MQFKDIFGHERNISLLKSFLKQGRLPHALLFHGAPGIGKKTTAKVFAKALNCTNDIYDSCDLCPSCQKVDHNNHLDVMIIKPDGQYIKIQAIRDLQQQLKFKPWEGKKRVCIIEDAERMNDVSANALLKTLEEPPSSNVIILITEKPHLLPATVASRCQQVRFNPLKDEDVVLYMIEKLHVKKSAARVLASSSGGSIERALELHNGAYLAIRDKILEMVSEENIQEPIIKLAHTRCFGDEREEVIERLEILRMFYRDVLLYRETSDINGLINVDRIEIIQNLSQRLQTREIIRNINIIDNVFMAIESNADRTLALETMMLRIAM